MLQDPKTQEILKNLFILAAIGLILVPLIDVAVAKGDFTQTNKLYLMAFKTPIVYAIALFLWFKAITLIITTYWGTDELSKGITASSMIIIIGAVLEKVNVVYLWAALEKADAMSLQAALATGTAPGSYATLIPPIGTAILLFGFIALFYQLVKYVWVKI